MKFSLLIIVLTFSLNLQANNYPTSLKNQSTLKVESDSVKMIKVIKGFLKFYKKHYKKANNFDFTITDDKGNYKVNLADCRKYLEYLKSSKYISENYVKEWMKYFEERSNHFKENHQNEGPPEGFDYDLLLNSQEPELIFNYINELKFKIKETSKEKSTIIMTGAWSYTVTMSNLNEKWKIDALAPIENK